MYKVENIYQFCILVFSIICGFLLSYYLEKKGISVNYSINNQQNIIIFRSDVFCQIFFQNCFIALLISIGGFLTGGLVSIIILFWNGAMIGGFFKYYLIDDTIIPYFIYHGIFEITAFLCFGIIGLKGWNFYRNLFKKNIIKFYFQKNLFVFSTIALFIGAIIETILISTLK
jgi:uncharacterized membrane protein SpoIIM required for sporulation